MTPIMSPVPNINSYRYDITITMSMTLMSITLTSMTFMSLTWTPMKWQLSCNKYVYCGNDGFCNLTELETNQLSDESVD